MDTNRADEAVIAASYRMTVIVCAALLVSLVIYVVLASFLVEQEGFAVTGEMPPILPPLLAAIGVGMLVVAQIVPALIARQARAAADIGERLRQAQTTVIIGMALRESTAIFGLVITLLTGEILWVLALAGLSALAMVVNWPRRSHLETIIAP
jgi:F0F1-type ATP synthase membrane subunit c/vacuolar-type H+-ATPase subunit K